MPAVFGTAIIHFQLHSPSQFLFLEMGASPVSLFLLCVLNKSAMCVYVRVSVYSKWVRVKIKSDTLTILTAFSC